VSESLHTRQAGLRHRNGPQQQCLRKEKEEEKVGREETKTALDSQRFVISVDEASVLSYRQYAS
jgi:hypothetical protein